MIAHVVVKVPDPLGQLVALFQYLLTVVAAEATHFFITMPILFWIFVRTNPYKYMRGCLKAFGMAFASSNRLILRFLDSFNSFFLLSSSLLKREQQTLEKQSQQM